jgi:ribosomal protein S18 acetylase RimI-like enzyme
MIGIRRVDRHDDAARDWGAALMASSDPWLTLRRSKEICRGALADPRNELLFASDASIDIGLAMVDPKGLAGAPYLKAIVIDEERRSRGAGSALLDHVERVIGRPAGNLFLCVSSFNGRARTLYERRGYAVIGEITDFVVAGASELIMRKRLA